MGGVTVGTLFAVNVLTILEGQTDKKIKHRQYTDFNQSSVPLLVFSLVMTKHLNPPVA